MSKVFGPTYVKLGGAVQPFSPAGTYPYIYIYPRSKLHSYPHLPLSLSRSPFLACVRVPAPYGFPPLIKWVVHRSPPLRPTHRLPVECRRGFWDPGKPCITGSGCRPREVRVRMVISRRTNSSSGPVPAGRPPLRASPAPAGRDPRMGSVAASRRPTKISSITTGNAGSNSACSSSRRPSSTRVTLHPRLPSGLLKPRRPTKLRPLLQPVAAELT